MTGAGKSKRSRANRRRMSQEYLEHWEDRLPTVDKQEPYKKLGLPLVLLPFVLMFCGGCVATAPTATLLIAALAGLMWFGDVVVEATKTESYWIVYRNQPLWKVGETKEEAASRRTEQRPVALADSDRYPEDYAGRIQGVIPYADARPSWALDAFDCAMFQMTDVQRQTCWQRAVKVVDGALVPVTFEDKFGATTESLRAAYTDAEVLVAKHSDDPVSVEILAKTLSLSKSLAKTITHTGTGLYAVKKVPTNESEVQDGAVAGQVVTIVGTVAASPAFTGGYITNTTQAETRAIVSHDTTTATLEGDISGWGTTDVLEWYDSWGTVDAAGEQLLVDQGVTDFSSWQEIRIYAGTYNEAINIGDLEPTSQYRLKFTVNGSDSVTLDNNGQAAALLELNNTENVEIHDMTLNCDNNYMIDANGRGPWWLYNCGCQGGNGGIVRDITVTGCTFTSQNYAFRTSFATFVQCTFTSCTDGAIWVAYLESLSFRGCVWDGCVDCLSVSRPQAAYTIDEYSLTVINCTVYDSTNFLNFTSVTNSNAMLIRVQNTIFHTVTTVWYGVDADADLVAQDCDYNTYYNCTQIARIGGSNLNFATWQGLTDHLGASPDANSLTTDPGITAPATDDWSLTAASDCRHAGVGSYSEVKSGINAVAFDKWHPDKGAWSSGAGPNVSYGS